MNTGRYTTELMKTTAAVQEIRELLELWEPGMEPAHLAQRVLDAGALGRSSATRVKDIVNRTFTQRFLRPDDRAARRARAAVEGGAGTASFRDIVFLYTLRAYPVIYDFLVERYWPLVYAGHESLRGPEIVSFLTDKRGTERMPEPWSDNVTARVARNLGKTLTDFGFFENNRSPIRRIRLWQASDFLLSYMLIEARQDGESDMELLAMPEWDAFGVDRRERVDRLHRLAGTAGPFLFQYSGEIAQFTFNYDTVEEFVHAAA
jgi:hypothetical protein